MRCHLVHALAWLIGVKHIRTFISFRRSLRRFFSPKANQLTILSSFNIFHFVTFGFKESFARNLSPSF
ncbi:MAG: hypothetical protein ACTS6A_02455 [Candidatus Hodgkinia cicadicola]